MAEHYTIDVIDGIIAVRVSREAGLHDIQRAVDDVAGRDGNTIRLWDVSSSHLNVSATQLNDLAAYVKAKPFPPSKVAIVAPHDLAYGLSRIYQVYREDEISEHRIFRTRRDAWHWLTDSAER